MEYRCKGILSGCSLRKYPDDRRGFRRISPQNHPFYGAILSGWHMLSALESAGQVVVSRVQIPSGTPNPFSNLRFPLLLYLGTKKAQFSLSMRMHFIEAAVFRTDRAISSRHKLGTPPADRSQPAAVADAWRRRMTLLCARRF